MIILLLIFTVLHLLFYFALFAGWRKIPSSLEESEVVSFSVVIPVRNEELVLEKLLACLEHQRYDRGKYEVLVVDDFSEDNTAQLVGSLRDRLAMDLRFIALDDQDKSGKKSAITKGVDAAKFDYVLTTDADCQMGPLWLSSYASAIVQNKFVAGPVALKGGGFFAKLQQAEFAGLMGFGAVTLSNGNPSICSGANLGFEKSTFIEVGGYADNLSIPSGDDEFLMYTIFQRYPREVAFLKSKAAIVITSTQTSVSRFINQRIRWTSKWKYHKSVKHRLTAVLFFFDYLLMLIGLGLTVSGDLPFFILPSLVLVRWVSSAIYILPVQKFLGHLNGPLPLLFLQIIYPFHVLFMGLNSIFGRYTWKGRQY